MKTNRFVNWFLAGFSLLTFLAFVGASTGTLAWYAYSTRASLSYKGVSIAKTEQLQVGIRDDAIHRIVFTDEVLRQNNCEPHDENNIVWAKPGSDLKQKIISGYLSGTDSDEYVNTLLPVTTKDRTIDDTSALTLYDHPTAGDPNQSVIADSECSIKLPLVFRILNNSGEYVGGENLWIARMNAIKAISSTRNDVAPALRIFASDVDNADHRLLINPTAENNGSTTVAGLLDLNNDKYYDHGLHDAYNAPKELIYGSYTGTAVYSSERLDADSDWDASVNSLSNSEKISGGSTFYAKHKEGNYTITNYDSLTLGKADYYGMNAIQPKADANTGSYGNSGKPIATTDATTKLARVDITIFLEGWDHAVIDQAIGCVFNLGLTFEIDRV